LTNLECWQILNLTNFEFWKILDFDKFWIFKFGTMRHFDEASAPEGGSVPSWGCVTFSQSRRLRWILRLTAWGSAPFIIRRSSCDRPPCGPADSQTAQTSLLLAASVGATCEWRCCCRQQTNECEPVRSVSEMCSTYLQGGHKHTYRSHSASPYCCHLQ
jgi:hypothetical protein